MSAKVAAACLALVVLFAVSLAWMRSEVAQSEQSRSEQDCAYRNYTRQQIRGAFTDLIEVLDPQRADPKTQEFERRLGVRYPDLPCSAPPSPNPPAP